MKKITLKIITVLTLITLGISSTNQVYFELLGPGLMGSINYENEFNSDKQISFRLGYGNFSDDESEITINPILLGINKLWGKKNTKYEIGFGISNWVFSADEDSSIDFLGTIIDEFNFTCYYVNTGIRYQKIGGNLGFKLGVSATFLPELYDNNIIPFPYISMGYRF